ncbi:MAG: polysaccharide deacetylase family protein [Planctomycetota bacterium]|nr:polysaccharide deacetylase family protein [Planctomycetota bacterium]
MSDDSITHAGLQYDWRPDAFLTRAESRYALKRLWSICAGVDATCDRPVMRIPAASRQDVERLFDASVNDFPFVEVERVLPIGASNPFDTETLPEACGVAESASREPGNGEFPFDLVAWTFLFLTRWEEVHRPQTLDAHGRIDRSGLLAVRHGFHQRPIVDEWALVLRAWIERLRPGVVAPLRRPTLRLTHDVDHPLRFPTLASVARRAIGTALRSNGRLDHVVRESIHGLRSRCNYECDANYRSLCRFMDFEEQLGLRGHYYFMSADPSTFDDGYRLQREPYRSIIREVQRRGHVVGWHPGYVAVDDAVVFQREHERIARAVSDIGGDANHIGGRHHYLRWNPATSWDQWSAAGLSFDSSVGFADCVGFRCGTSHPYPVFSLSIQRELELMEAPLHIMECGLERECSGDLNVMRSRAETIVNRSIAVGGQCVVLIHNGHDEATVAVLLEVIRDAMQLGIRDVPQEPVPVDCSFRRTA